MAKAIPQEFRDLFECRALAHLATVSGDGVPHITPVWVSYDGEYVLVNSAKGRVKDRYIRANPHVGLSIVDPNEPYRYISVQGTVVEISEDGAQAHMDALCQRYTGKARWNTPPGQTRVIYRIAPTKVITYDS